MITICNHTTCMLFLWITKEDFLKIPYNENNIGPPSLSLYGQKQLNQSSKYLICIQRTQNMHTYYLHVLFYQIKWKENKER